MARGEKTRKWVASNYTCYGTGYCDLQYLLKYQSRDYYTSGIYGWNFDVYTFRDYAITTGYRSMIHHIKRDFELDKKYDDMARDIYYNRQLSWDEQKRRINNLLAEYLHKIFGDESIKVYEG